MLNIISDILLIVPACVGTQECWSFQLSDLVLACVGTQDYTLVIVMLHLNECLCVLEHRIICIRCS